MHSRRALDWTASLSVDKQLARSETSHHICFVGAITLVGKLDDGIRMAILTTPHARACARKDAIDAGR